MISEGADTSDQTQIWRTFIPPAVSATPCSGHLLNLLMICPQAFHVKVWFVRLLKTGYTAVIKSTVLEESILVTIAINAQSKKNFFFFLGGGGSVGISMHAPQKSVL